jgi:hypothetical protein
MTTKKKTIAEITEKEWDDLIFKSVRNFRMQENMIDKAINDVIEMYNDKQRQKSYPEQRLKYYYDGEKIWFAEVKTKTGFI